MAQQITITATGSAYTDSASPNTNFKGASLFAASTQRSMSSSSTQKSAYCKFDKSAWPTGKKIVGAQLNVFVAQKEARNIDEGHAELFFCIQDFDVNAVAYNNSPRILSPGARLTFDEISTNADNIFSLKTTAISSLIDYVYQHGIVLNARFVYSVDRYPVTASLEIHSASGAHPPRLVLTVEDVVPYVSSAYPNSGFIDDKAAVSFSWGMDYPASNMVGALGYSGAKFQWREVGSSAIHEIPVSQKMGITVPANTFPVSKNIEWRVAVISQYGVISAFCDWMTLSTVDSLSAARVVSPKATYLTGNEANTFTWEHIIASGTAQTKAELQYSTDAGASWKALKTVTGSAKSVVLPAGALPGGSLLWRVRTYNSDNIAGTWSESAAIVVHAAPNRPGMMPVDPVPRPQLRWQSAEQQSFEVRVDDWSSGPVFGTVKEYRVPFWLADGSHSLAVRVQSSLGLWSDWSEVIINVANTPPGDIRLTSRAIDNGARLTWTGTCQRYIIYRDGAAIGETTVTQWVDWLAAGKHRYQVRGVTGEYYAMSNVIIEFSQCRWGVISAIDSIDWVPLRTRQGSQPGHNAESSRPVTLRYFDGRALPVAEVSPFVDRTHTYEYTLRREERALLPALRALLGQMVIYKNRAGTRVIGILASLSEQDDGRLIELSFAITETDWREYDEA